MWFYTLISRMTILTFGPGQEKYPKMGDKTNLKITLVVVCPLLTGINPPFGGTQPPLLGNKATFFVKTTPSGW